MDLSRREFMLVGTTSALSLSGGGVSPQVSQHTNNEYEFRGVADLMGPSSARPPPGSDFFDDKIAFGYRYEETDTGNRYYIETGDSRWQELMTNPETQVDEVRTTEFESFFNHTFARPSAPDDKNWLYTDADVTKQNSEVELAATTALESTQHGNYPPGSESVPGVAWRVTGTPTDGRADAGYFNDNDGIGVGEDATDSYVFIRGGGTEVQIYRSNWNGYSPNSRVWVSDRPVISRFPHLFYGGGSFEFRALLHDNNESKLRTLHTFTPDNVSAIPNGPPIQQPNLPIQFESTSLAGGSLRANASHYTLSDQQGETRINGEHFVDVSATDTGWTPIVLFRKKSGWDMVNVKPVNVASATKTNDIKLELQLNPTVTDTTTTQVTNTTSDETAVEMIDIGNSTVSADGERRWSSYRTAGQGSQAATLISEKVDFNLPALTPIGLYAQGVGGTAEISGSINWEEFF